jgi:hypothetical protein
MIISIIAIVKWLLFALSGGALYRGFSHDGDSDALPAKVAGGVTALLTMVAFVSDATGIFASDEISKSEQLFWESVEKHPSEKLYRDYMEKYPDGQFKNIALTQAVNYGKTLPVATIEQPAIPAKIEQSVTAPIEPAQAIPTVKPLAEWQTIDHYQVKGGLVKDIKTGLIWMRCTMGQNWDGSTCQGNSTNYEWQQAMKAPSDFSYGDYNDWRVPTLDELKTLIYCSNGKMLTDDGHPVPFDDTRFTNGCDVDNINPAIMENVFPQTPFTAWSSSVDKNVHQLFVSFHFGRVETTSMDSYSSVRLVRSEKTHS